MTSRMFFSFTCSYVNRIITKVVDDIRDKKAIENLSASIVCRRDVWKHFVNLGKEKLRLVNALAFYK